MLGGLYPLLVFQFYEGQFFDKIQEEKIPMISDFVKVAGAPIPLYLYEPLTGLIFDEGSFELSVTTETITGAEIPGPEKKKKKAPVVKQKVVSASVVINMRARADSLILNAILAMCTSITEKLTDQNYAISYFNGPTVVIKGLLEGFRFSRIEGTDMLSIEMTLSRSNNPESETKEVEERTDSVPILNPVAAQIGT